MSSTITVRGFAATQPKFYVSTKGVTVTSFRLGASERRWDPQTKGWVTGSTSWYSVACFRELATNVFASINKGDPVLITGRLKVSEWSAGDKRGVDVEIEAEAVGQDLRWGQTTGFARPPKSADGPGGETGAEAAGVKATRAGEPRPPAWADPGAAILSAHTVDAGEPAPIVPPGVLGPVGDLFDDGVDDAPDGAEGERASTVAHSAPF